MLLCTLSLVLAVGSCSNADVQQNVWSTSEDGILVWGPDIQDTPFSWNGGRFGNVAHGKGILEVLLPDSSISRSSYDAYYGALSKDYVRKASDSEFFVGDVIDGKSNGFGVLVKETDVYLGNFKNGLPDGKLTMFRGGSVYYEGQWTAGSFDGEGTLYKEDGSVKSGIWSAGTLVSADVTIESDAGTYTGLISDGKPNGFGRLKYKNGFEYEGDWQDGLWNGVGQYVAQGDTVISEWSRGVASGNTIMILGNLQFEGNCQDNVPNGEGTLYSLDPEDSSVYAGDWKNGTRHGYGDALFSNGDSYFGEWENDEYSGIGRYRYNNGDVYDGEWSHNLPNGEGQYVSSEFKYGGEWLDGWIHGFGRLDFSNGDVYEGEFCEGKKCGDGLYQYANGNVYEGEFFDDKINGLGVFTFSDGNRYEGEFLDGKIFGNGTLYYQDSTGVVCLTAFWDKPNQFPSEASILFPNGDVYEGPILNGEPTSEGVWYHVDEKTGDHKLVNAITSANDFYKEHRETWNKVVIFTSVALTAVEIGATIAAPFTGGTSLVVAKAAKAAHAANKALNAVDIVLAISSAAIDLATAETSEEREDAAITLGKEVAINGALLLVPKALKSGPVQKITNKLSTTATTAIRKPLVQLSKKTSFGKIISVVKNTEKKAILAFEKSKVGQKYYRVTGKASYQYVTNEQVQKIVRNNPSKRPGYHPGTAGDGKVLGQNALEFMSDKAKRRYNVERRIMGSRRAQWHHAIAGNKSNASAEECRQILAKFKIDINDPRNAVLLPVEPNSIMKGTIHGKHVNSYDDYVLARLKQATTPEQCLEVMDDIKKELYKGQLQLLAQHRVNTALGTVTRNSTY